VTEHPDLCHRRNNVCFGKERKEKDESNETSSKNSRGFGCRDAGGLHNLRGHSDTTDACAASTTGTTVSTTGTTTRHARASRK
jgi:hypothetical protein